MDIKDVENLAELARIELSEEEKKDILKDMDGILEYVKQIEEVEVEDAVKDYSLKNAWREDLPAQAGEIESRGFSHELIVEQFPDSQPARPHDNLASLPSGSRQGAGGGVFLKVKKIL